MQYQYPLSHTLDQNEVSRHTIDPASSVVPLQKQKKWNNAVAQEAPKKFESAGRNSYAVSLIAVGLLLQEISKTSGL